MERMTHGNVCERVEVNNSELPIMREYPFLNESNAHVNLYSKLKYTSALQNVFKKKVYCGRM